MLNLGLHIQVSLYKTGWYGNALCDDLADLEKKKKVS